MPTITVNMKDMEALVGRAMDMDAFAEYLRLAKAELDSFDAESGEARVELCDTNRPDLWSAEGVARQIRSHLSQETAQYLFFREGQKPETVIEVDPRLERVRPFVAAFIAKGPAVTNDFLVQIIQTQEKLCENYGRKRLNVAIGIYNAAKIRFPVKYIAARPGEYAFTPLGFEETMPLERIVKEHPKGQEYGTLVEGLGAYPLLVDAADRVLSFPPIINSRETGEVMVGDDHLFIEATGDNIRKLLLSMNIMAANFADRGWEVKPVLSRFSYESGLGREVVTPSSLLIDIEVEVERVSRALGEVFTAAEVCECLKSYGVEAKVKDDAVVARCPAFRDDYLHPMDVVEDFAISRGYNSFEPLMPTSFSVGKLKPITLLIDRIRDHMVGFGFEEVFSNILSNRSDERERMLVPGEPIVAIDNVMSETYSVLRSSILPSLLRVEAKSAMVLYPHRLFEAGEVCLLDPQAAAGSRTEQRLAALWAGADSGFSQIHSILDLLFYYLSKDYKLQPLALPFYFEGRSGEVFLGGESIGSIGEVHPAVLTNYGISVPCTAFELRLEIIR